MTSKQKKRPWPTNAEQAAYMKMRQVQNKANSLRNPNENWMAGILAQTKYKWSRQVRWGYRLFDFWCHELGMAVEVDGPDHRPEKDRLKDLADYKISGIVVLRVRNKNESDAAIAISKIHEFENWNTRRYRMGLKLITNCAPPIQR